MKDQRVGLSVEVAIDPRIRKVLKSGSQSRTFLALQLANRKEGLSLGELASVSGLAVKTLEDKSTRRLMNAEMVEREYHPTRGKVFRIRDDAPSIDIPGPASGSCDGMHPKRRKAKSLDITDVEKITGAE